MIHFLNAGKYIDNEPSETPEEQLSCRPEQNDVKNIHDVKNIDDVKDIDDVILMKTTSMTLYKAPPPPPPPPSKKNKAVQCRKLSWDVVGPQTTSTVWSKVSRD